MAKYKLISKKLYELETNSNLSGLSRKELLQKEYEKRLAYPSTRVLSIEIHPFSKIKQILLKESYPLFYTLLEDHLVLSEKIFKGSRKIYGLRNSLPDIAQLKISVGQMLKEIKNNNDIEGVQSTRKELSEAFYAQASKENVRFMTTVNQYSHILGGKKLEIYKLEDFREIYDALLLDEISEEDMPDGRLFRTSFVGIGDGYSGKFVHQGLPSEEDINLYLTDLIAYMNDDSGSEIIKAIVSHYIFEYIHPFYDGNGRMGRYMISTYLANKLDTFTGLSISEAIKNNKKKYASSFSQVSNPENRGELSLFILNIMEIIAEGQENIIAYLMDAHRKLGILEDFIKSLNLDSYQEKIFFIMVQDFLFSFSEKPTSNMEIHDILKGTMARTKVDKTIASLEVLGLVEKVSKTPKAYRVLAKALPDLD